MWGLAFYSSNMSDHGGIEEREILRIETSQKTASAENAARDLGSLTAPTVEANFNHTVASRQRGARAVPRTEADV